MLDWFGSALAGKGVRPVAIMERFAAAMGPAQGPSEVYRQPTHALRRSSRRWSTPPPRMSPSRTTCTTARCSIPAAVVFPPALAVAQAIGARGPRI